MGITLAVPYESPLRVEADAYLRRLSKRRDVTLEGFGEEVILGVADEPSVLDNILTFFPIPSAAVEGGETVLERRKKVLMTLPVYVVLPVENAQQLETTIKRLRIALKDHADTVLLESRLARYRGQEVHSVEEQLSESSVRLRVYYAWVGRWFLMSVNPTVMTQLIDEYLDRPDPSAGPPQYARLTWTDIDPKTSALGQSMMALYRGIWLPSLKRLWRSESLSLGDGVGPSLGWLRVGDTNPYGKEWAPTWQPLTSSVSPLGKVLAQCDHLDLGVEDLTEPTRLIRVRVRCQAGRVPSSRPLAPSAARKLHIVVIDGLSVNAAWWWRDPIRIFPRFCAGLHQAVDV